MPMEELKEDLNLERSKNWTWKIPNPFLKEHSVPMQIKIEKIKNEVIYWFTGFPTALSLRYWGLTR